ncbi:PhzF family phenazine biosynthesis protein [Parapedobacter koreensis]|uniref:Phenazine biosynthesis protein PhzF family n=1 Tax=Parapedobacter koreensis TaxID=332977 RepID=A0A1H7T195_9SPHI|nr:PhzF family phenazine biosynthesis protein [Parapedobacter koreensis]SEL78285.1 phenazine biosynthesis protein PhzF family [Parapedobacter koreensis]
MTIKLYQIDAFTDRVFSGNPAAVCPLDAWLDDTLMQQIAMENNLAETAFYVKRDDEYDIRWFTPTVEVDLCGHATLASAFVLFNHEGYEADTIRFHSPRSGPLIVKREGEYLTLNFPTDVIAPVPLTVELAASFDGTPLAAYKGKTDYLLIFESEAHIQSAKPDLARIAQLAARGVIITAPGNEVDFVSRFFGPQSGVDEDPVTGSAHTTLIPYWAGKLGKNELTARQLSVRGGYLQCSYLGDRVAISGQAKRYLTGEIHVA